MITKKKNTQRFFLQWTLSLVRLDIVTILFIFLNFIHL